MVGSLLQAASKQILCLGSGDASQQRSMVEQNVRNVTTTFYDSEAQVIAKYPPAAANIEYLREHAHVDASPDVEDWRRRPTVEGSIEGSKPIPRGLFSKATRLGLYM